MWYYSLKHSEKIHIQSIQQAGDDVDDDNLLIKWMLNVNYARGLVLCYSLQFFFFTFCTHWFVSCPRFKWWHKNKRKGKKKKKNTTLEIISWKRDGVSKWPSVWWWFVSHVNRALSRVNAIYFHSVYSLFICVI